jgi:SPOR domain
MSGSALATSPQVNLDEFERRLRAAGSSPSAHEDPLRELARLVGSDASAPRLFGRNAAAPKVEPPPLAEVRLPHISDAELASPFEAEASEAEPDAPLLEGAPLRGVLEETHPADMEPIDVAPIAESPPSTHDFAAEASAPRRRSGRSALVMSLLVGVGAVAVVGAWGIKGAPGLPKTPPVIMAADTPTKVQPPSQDNVASPSDTASVLLKDQTAKPTPVKLVSSEEQPVDLQQQSSQAAAASMPVTALPTPPTTRSIAPIPVPAAAASNAAPAAPTPTVALATVGPAAAPAAPAPFPEPKRVKTVSVRPDGSLISSAQAAEDAPTVVANADSSAAPAANADASATPAGDATASVASDGAASLPANPPVPVKRPTFSSSAAQAATPKLDLPLPTKLSGKSTARVPIAKTDTTVVANADVPAQAQAPAPAADAPLKNVPLLSALGAAVGGAPRSREVSANDPTSPQTTGAVSGAGAYTVQLAAPASEKEAQSASTRLQAKYSAELGGLQPSIHAADLNGKSIYRVRVGSLSRADAVTLCMKLKASGGDAACFVAKN